MSISDETYEQIKERYDEDIKITEDKLILLVPIMIIYQDSGRSLSDIPMYNELQNELKTKTAKAKFMLNLKLQYDQISPNASSQNQKLKELGLNNNTTMKKYNKWIIILAIILITVGLFTISVRNSASSALFISGTALIIMVYLKTKNE